MPREELRSERFLGLDQIDARYSFSTTFPVDGVTPAEVIR